MKYGFIKTAAATPHISVADPSANIVEIIKLIEQADTCGVELLVFPELCVTGYTCGELFLSDVLMHSASDALNTVCKATVGKKALIFVGSPIWDKGKLYSCAVAFQNGKVLGVVPKTALPSYSEFYELRHFVSGRGISDSIKLCGQTAPFGTNIILRQKITTLSKLSLKYARICL